MLSGLVQLWKATKGSVFKFESWGLTVCAVHLCYVVPYSEINSPTWVHGPGKIGIRVSRDVSMI